MKKILRMSSFIIVVIIMVFLSIWITPKILSLKNEEVQIQFRQFIDSFGIFGYFIMVGIQILQIIVAIIPGEPIELIMGLMYGTFGGMLLCLLGIVIGTLIVFYSVKKFGTKFVDKFVNSKQFEKLGFLHDPMKRDSFLFLLFFIPGTPKDILTYFVPFLNINLLRFIVMSTLARIPSVISSTFIGSNISDGNLSVSISIFAITGVAGLIGIWVNNKIIHQKNKS